MCPDLSFKIEQFGREFLLAQNKLPQFHECPHNKNTHFDGARRIENCCSHNGAMFGEGVGQPRRELEVGEVVTICDHLLFLAGVDLKHKIRREPVTVLVTLLIRSSGWQESAITMPRDPP
jgi:hypothetical protein